MISENSGNQHSVSIQPRHSSKIQQLACFSCNWQNQFKSLA